MGEAGPGDEAQVALRMPRASAWRICGGTVILYRAWGAADSSRSAF